MGIFRTSNEIVFVKLVTIAKTITPVCSSPGEAPLPGGSQDASTLFDVVVAGVSGMGRDFTGLINTSGGDSLGLAQAGGGGSITYHGGGLAPIPLGINHTDNNPLIIPPGIPEAISSLTNFTDIIIDGTAILPVGITGVFSSGTFFMSPTGRVITADQQNASSLVLSNNGSPIINGLIDLRGKNGEIDPSFGGMGGEIVISTATEGPLFIPTIVMRGGDSDQSDCPERQVDPPLLCTRFIAGSGGNVMISSLEGDIIFSGTRTADNSYIPDTLPPPPPFNFGTPEKRKPDPGERLPLLLSTIFNRGVLTSGGIGGSGTGTGFVAEGGGTGGDGGKISILSSGGNPINIIFRDIDLFTGGGIEQVVADIPLKIPVPPFVELMPFDAPTGSLGGKGRVGARGGDGGRGGRGGNIEIGSGVTINPLPVNFSRQDILGQNGGNPFLSTADVIGVRVSASDSTGKPLYRLNVFDDAGIEKTLGGSGGFPGGRGASFSLIFFGLKGEGGALTGLLTK